jgi:hypothetical protein
MTTRDTETLSARARDAIAELYYAHSEVPDTRENQARQESLQ